MGYLVVTDNIESPHELLHKARLFLHDDTVTGLIIEIEGDNSALGTAQFIHTELAFLKNHYKKPIIGVLCNRCIGGNYLIACASDYIIASPLTVIGILPTNQTHKIDSIDQHHTPDLQKALYLEYIRLITESRSLADQKHPWQAGTWITGTEAKRVRLIDELGSYATAYTYLQKNGLLDGPIELIESPDQEPWTYTLKKQMLYLVKTMNHAYTALTAQPSGYSTESGTTKTQ